MNHVWSVNLTRQKFFPTLNGKTHQLLTKFQLQSCLRTSSHIASIRRVLSRDWNRKKERCYHEIDLAARVKTDGQSQPKTKTQNASKQTETKKKLGQNQQRSTFSDCLDISISFGNTFAIFLSWKSNGAKCISFLANIHIHHCIEHQLPPLHWQHHPTWSLVPKGWGRNCLTWTNSEVEDSIGARNNRNTLLWSWIWTRKCPVHSRVQENQTREPG